MHACGFHAEYIALSLIRVFDVRMFGYPECSQWRFWPDCANTHMYEGKILTFRLNFFWFDFVCLFALRFYGPVNPVESCRTRSVYLTTWLLGRLSPLSCWKQYCAHSFARNWQLPFLNQWKGENDRRKYFLINLHERMLPTSAGVEPAIPWSPVRRRIQLSHRGLFLFDIFGVILCQDHLRRDDAISTKEDNFCVFLLALLHAMSIQKRNQLYKERICSLL